MNGLKYNLIFGVLRLVSYLPFSILYLLSDILSFTLYHVIKYRRKVVWTNLVNSFPEKSESELRSIERKFYTHLSDIIVETIKSITISASEIRKRFQIENLEILTEVLAQNQSIIAVSGHYGNWEWGPIRIALTIKDPVLVVYKPLSNHKFDQFINSVRSKFGTIMVPMKHTLRKLVELKNNAHVLVLVGDQTPPREESQYFTRFLNQDTPIFLGVEKIAKRFNYPVFYFSIKSYKRGYYICSVKPIVKDPNVSIDYQITDTHTRLLEEDIQNCPENWLWSHKRWKFKPEDVK